MNIISPPDLDIVSWSMSPYNSSDQIVANRYTGKRELYRKGPGSWAGTVRFGTSKTDYESYLNARRLLIRFHTLLQGLNNQVKLNLPKEYQSIYNNIIRDDMRRITIPSTNIQNNILTAVIDIPDRTSDAGTYRLLTGDYISINNRLYFAHSVDQNNDVFTVQLLPEVPIENHNNAVVVVKNVFVNANLDATQPMLLDGKKLIAYTFPFVEHA